MPDPEKDILNKNNRSPLRAVNEPVEQQLADASEKEVELTTGDKEDSISITRSRASTVSEHSDHNDAADEKRAKQAAAPATLSRTTSVTPDAIIVPRANRHGLLATFSVIPEVENPYHYRRKTKWLITTTVAICAMAAPMGSAIVMPTLQDIAKDFNASSTVTNMSVAVYMLSMSIFPLWWSSFSETTGRRTIYLTSFILFVLFAILSAVATNISMLIVMRTFSGGAAASVQAVGAGTVADIWEPRERGRAMGLFYLGPLCGPLLAPIIGGVLAQELGWRSTQWFLVIYGGVTVLLIIFALPETLRAKTTKPAHPTVSSCAPGSRNGNGSSSADQDLTRISTRASAAQRTKSFLSHIRRFLLDPLIVITWLRFPPVALTVYYASITFGSLYILNISIQATFARPPYNFSTLILGLLYIPGSIGYLLASLFGGRWIDQIMQREARKAGRYDDTGKLIYIPEDRMRENAWIAAVLWPGALIWYGWTVEKGIHWVVPMIANFFFGVGSMLIFALASTMLTEFMPKRASAGIAINNFVRNIFSFTGAVVAEPIIGSIGNGWIMTILGVWSLGSGLAVVWVMQRYGPRWRGRMVEALG